MKDVLFFVKIMFNTNCILLFMCIMYIKYILYFLLIMYINIYSRNDIDNTMKNYTVKARKRHGSNSIDLTLPAGISKEYSINPGDIFKIIPDMENGTLTLTYKLIYHNEDE